MKRFLFNFVLFLSCQFTPMLGQDSLYVFKNGKVDFRVALTDMDSVSFTDVFAFNLADKVAMNPSYSLFNEALVATGYANQIRINLAEDRTYNPDACPWSLKTYNIKEEIPPYRKLGFTLLMESNQTLAAYTSCPLCPNGVKTLDDLKLLAKYFYSRMYQGSYSDGEGIEDMKDPRNYLNRFVAYHLLNRRLQSSRFISDFDTPNQIKQFDMYEFIETMLPNTLIKVKLERDHPLTSYMNLTDESDTNSGVQMTMDINNKAADGYYHGIDKPLVYSRSVEAKIASERIRTDVASFFPELASNDMRGNNPTAVNDEGKAHRYILPSGYCTGLTFTPNTRMTYLNANGIYEDYQGDELYVEGVYDFSVRTIPIPAGTYEVRFGYYTNLWLGIIQLYMDSIACGAPVDFSLRMTDIIKMLPDTIGNDPTGAVQDSLMHLIGFMRAPSSYRCSIPLYGYSTISARLDQSTLRRVIGTFTFDKPGNHTIRWKSLGSKNGDVNLSIDYIEFVPVSLLPKEGTD